MESWWESVNWLRIGTCGGLLWTGKWIFGFKKGWEFVREPSVYWLLEQDSAQQSQLLGRLLFLVSGLKSLQYFGDIEFNVYEVMHWSGLNTRWPAHPPLWPQIINDTTRHALWVLVAFADSGSVMEIDLLLRLKFETSFAFTASQGPVKWSPLSRERNYTPETLSLSLYMCRNFGFYFKKRKKKRYEIFLILWSTNGREGEAGKSWEKRRHFIFIGEREKERYFVMSFPGFALSSFWWRQSESEDFKICRNADWVEIEAAGFFDCLN
jgi:hypothetical protein